MSAQRAELAEIIGRHCPQDGQSETAIDGLILIRGSNCSTQSCTIMTSIFAVMAQGAKRMLVGDIAYEYDARHYMITSVDLPIFSRITQASADQPYLGMALAIDPVKIGELGHPRRSTGASPSAS